MRFEALLVGLGSSLVTGAIEAPIEGYGVEVMQWEIELTPGGEMVKTSGTIQEAVAHLKTLNPNFEREYPLLNTTTTTAETAAVVPGRRGNLSKRYDVDSYFCHDKWAWADRVHIRQGIEYLRTVRGRPGNGPGPGNCGRVSCSFNAGIWWCNDNSEAKTLDDYGDIADAAQVIDDNCVDVGHTPAGLPILVESGQVFYKDGWNVIVRYDRDNC